MASRKEEKERLQQAREAAEAADRRQERKRLILGYVVAGLITVAVGVGIVFAIIGGGDGGGEASGDRVDVSFGGIVPEGVSVDDRDAADPPGSGAGDLEAAAEEANCELLLDQEDGGNTHIDPSSDPPRYDANPPSSGDHSPEPLADGAFADPVSPLNFIHTLEHGRVEIQYSPEIGEQAELELLGLFDEDSAGMALFPNPDMPYEVAAVAWRNTLGCDSYEGAATLDAIRAFRTELRGRGPERIPF